jgi:hypothetical protein
MSMLSDVTSLIMLSVVRLNVVMPGVVAPATDFDCPEAKTKVVSDSLPQARTLELLLEVRFLFSH